MTRSCLKNYTHLLKNILCVISLQTSFLTWKSFNSEHICGSIKHLRLFSHWTNSDVDTPVLSWLISLRQIFKKQSVTQEYFFRPWHKLFMDYAIWTGCLALYATSSVEGMTFSYLLKNLFLLKNLWNFYFKATLLKSHFSMGVLLQICCIFSEHLFLGTPLGGMKV